MLTTSSFLPFSSSSNRLKGPKKTLGPMETFRDLRSVLAFNLLICLIKIRKETLDESEFCYIVKVQMGEESLDQSEFRHCNPLDQSNYQHLDKQQEKLIGPSTCRGFSLVMYNP